MDVIESAIHLAEHGDLAHDSHDRGGAPLGSGEHGCSGTFHLCGHSASMISPSQLVVVSMTLSLETNQSAFPPDSCLSEGATAPPIRPPIG